MDLLEATLEGAVSVRQPNISSNSQNGNRRSPCHQKRQQDQQQQQQQQRRRRLKVDRRSIDPDDDLPTLLDIFQFLDSPDSAPYIDVCMSSCYSDIFQACIGDSTYAGMRTQLYKYQKNSLFKMLKRELLPDFFLDPNYIPLRTTGPETDKSIAATKKLQHPLLPYFQFAHGFDDATNPWVYKRSHGANDGPVRPQDVTWYSDTRGGIICEDMGTGKTCECLALVLLTKRQMASPPAEGQLLPCVGTVASALATDLDGSQEPSTDSRNGSVRSLKCMAARAALLSCAESLRVMHDDGLLPSAMWSQLEPYQPYYWVNPIVENRPRRGTSNYSAEQMSFKVYVSSTTIVVVPDNLVDQWVREKYKHIEDTGGLEMLKIDSSTLTVPEPKKLIQYDVVLISVSRLSKEYIPIDTNISGLRYLCRCYSQGLEQCACGKRREAASYRSPLLRVHWKRLVVDEGHIMSSRNAARSLIAAYLIADRRWVCTGTPTHNLVHATSEIFADYPMRSADDPDDLLQAESSGSLTVSECSQSPDCRSPAERHRHKRRRYKVGLKESSADFFQLGMLVSKFLRVDPFAQSTSHWASIMVQPYKRNEPGARGRLRALMQSIMVRNRPESIGCEVQIPPLHEKAVTLLPSRLQMLTYNTVVAFFHINAVLTERVGRDYFFHPENKKHLRQIVENLFLSCFWFSASLKHIKDGIDNGQRALDLWNQGKKPYSDDDVTLLRRSISALQRASEDNEWVYAMQAASVGYQAHGLPARMQAGCFLYDSELQSSVTLLTADQIANINTRAKTMLATSDDNLPPLSSNLSPQEFEMVGSACVSACTSSKVAYVVNCVRRYQHDEKCIVFVSTQNEAASIDDALQLARIPHLVYSSYGMSQSQRRHNITTFSTSMMYNTIVMDVHLAAYGIDLSAASRVWFVSPIWQAARERQAIKRAHRLGQVRPVYVETLLTAESVEQALWTRRQELSCDSTEVISGGVEEDGKMRSMLSNTRFVESCDEKLAPFSTQIPILQANTRYPQLLLRKYDMWRPGSPLGATKQVPFFKTKRLVLNMPDVSEAADQASRSGAGSFT
ncbi:hypothetical protein IW138_004107 [Coemansia sp. RSA 986]|nr:hypothetical protein IW138_004107 [Coemansia sp. RSA 986]